MIGQTWVSTKTDSETFDILDTSFELNSVEISTLELNYFLIFKKLCGLLRHNCLCGH